MEQKTQPKFLLPPPKFDKPNAATKASHHYLTPSGMTLLPRAKQPPPMYGARGATVPAKYLVKEQFISKDTPSVPETPPVYKSPPRPEYCYTCGMELANSQDMQLHMEQHEQCPADDCDFAALHNILERHIEANHITGAYKRVKKVWTEEELAAWKAERRKRFPTVANVELTRLAREQRMKRGERLEASKSRFGNREDRQRTRPKNDNKERSKPTNKKKRRGQKKPDEAKKKEPTSNEAKEEKESSTSEVKSIEEEEPKDKQTNLSSFGSGKFLGTGQMTDYKHFREKIPKKDNALIGLLGMYGSDSEDESATESEEMVDDPNEGELAAEDPKFHKESDRNKGPDLAGKDIIKDLVSTKDISFEGTITQPSENVPSTSVKASSSSVKDVSDVVQNESFVEASSPAKENDSSSDEAPDEEPFQRVTEAIMKSDPPKPQPKKEPKAKIAPKRAPPKRVYGLNFKKARKATQQNTLLSKLLESDIRHERNVLLQCVRHVCERNFFGIGQSRDASKNFVAEEVQMVPACNKECAELVPAVCKNSDTAGVPMVPTCNEEGATVPSTCDKPEDKTSDF